MRKLSTIHKRENLNEVFAADEPGIGNANHEYIVMLGEEPVEIAFQHAPRHEPGSISGVLDTDLLEIVRDRLRGFQSGDFPAARTPAPSLTSRRL